MVDSFTIEFHFTNKDKVYSGDSFDCKRARQRFFSELLLAIWKVNIDCSDMTFPLHKILVDTKDDYDLPSLDISMPERIMQTFENKD
jgi:hypothetical protein